jgi:hypothetical protein
MAAGVPSSHVQMKARHHVFGNWGLTQLSPELPRARQESQLVLPLPPLPCFFVKGSCNSGSQMVDREYQQLLRLNKSFIDNNYYAQELASRTARAHHTLNSSCIHDNLSPLLSPRVMTHKWPIESTLFNNTVKAKFLGSDRE